MCKTGVCSINAGKLFISIILLLLSASVYGQFAIVHDPDGFCNVRSKPVVDPENVIGRLNNGDIVYSFERLGNWTEVVFMNAGENHNGYIYHDRLINVSNYAAMKDIVDLGDAVMLLNDSIEITLERQRFNAVKHKLVYEEGKYLKAIDGGEVWGQDGGVPSWEYKSIHVRFQDGEVLIPSEAICDLYEPELVRTRVYYDATSHTLYMEAVNGDGAGTYFVMWRIVSQRYVDRFVFRY